MKLLFVDRINGHTYSSDQIEGLLQQGRWLLQVIPGNNGLSKLVYNDVNLPLPESVEDVIELPVFPDPQGRFELQCFDRTGTRHSWELTQPEGSALPTELAAFIGDFNRRLKNQCAEHRFRWSGLENISFFASRELSSTAEWTELDDIIADAMPSILYICHRPRRHLMTQDALLPVEAVKRVTPSTLHHLSSHSEHWLTRTVTGVKPKRLLSEVYEEKYDIYENCVLVTLVNRVFHYVSRKLEALEKIEIDLVRQLEAEHFATEFLNFRRLQRLHELWKRNDDLKSTIDEIKALNERIGALRDQIIQTIYSPLYRKLSRAQDISSPLKATNLFIFDPNYSKIAQLWEHFESYADMEKEQQKSSGEGQAIAYFNFCLMAILFALKQLDYVPLNGHDAIDLWSETFKGEAELTAMKGNWKVTISVREERRMPLIRIRIQNSFGIPDKTIELLAVASMLPKYENEARDWIDSLYGASDLRDGVVRYIVHLSSLDALPDNLDPSYVRLSSTLGDNFMSRREYDLYGGGRLGLFALSPWDANSIERLGRVLLLHTTGEQLMLMDRADALLSFIHFLAYPNIQELKQFVRQNRSSILSSGPSGTRSAVYNKLVSLIAERDRRQFDTIWNNAQLLPLTECPVCSSENIHREDGDSTCKNCHSSWGMRLCSGCGRPVPKLVAGLNLEEAISPGDYKRTAITMENLLGRDMLSPLCESRSHFGSMWVICPHCGNCNNADSCQDCTHCRSLAEE
ncbi:DUF2357 domain-containing protein [Paenibacillus sp. GCM10023248]|uniref:DUF2357 domain-containing protein n=1 Tax=unclassified Paenibacillus TaxID=185978 RepID=UPI002378F299|nr:DUF2357 domain-containing protein [Paenibacillus sp. MAHUQ-63]MDD9271490.1 DUF2357 domain-containing protein [Paenibacillus sp. MAHUQ-63]